MNDIDFIKWMCEKAEGFSVTLTNRLRYSGEHAKVEGLIGYFAYTHVLYPFLLQRAIEGVNKGSRFEISQFKDRCFLTDFSNTCGYPYRFSELKGIDQAKESALRYIYEQEKSND